MARLLFNGQEIADVTYSGGGGGSIDYCDFCNEYIRLPFALSADHKVYLDYELGYYINDMQILGNSGGTPQNFYHGLYNNQFYVYTNEGEKNFSLPSGSTWYGRHEIIFNDSGRVTFDGADKFSGKPNTNSNLTYMLGYRGSGIQLTGRVYRFYIYDTVNDEYICDLMPVLDNGKASLKDIINDVLYTPERWT